MKPVAAHFETSWRSLCAGGFGSLLLHIAVILIVSLSLRGCQKVGSGDPGGEPFRDVGLFVLEGAEGAAETGLAPGVGDQTETQEARDQTSKQPSRKNVSDGHSDTAERLPSEAPDVADLLNMSDSPASTSGESSGLPALIGPGNPIGGIRRPAQGGGSGLIEPTEAGGAARLGGIGGTGDTTFMDISSVGKTFVYVIDTSSSMYGSRLKIAQSQLKKSLRLLQPNQQFAVLFYNESREVLKLRPADKQPMHYATDLNKQLASQQIDRITSDRGTEHKPAILEGLSLKPDVLYFLTDGEDDLAAADLRDIAQYTGKTTIHVIKFGDGTVSSRQLSWLQRLAAQSDGEFREINVK